MQLQLPVSPQGAWDLGTVHTPMTRKTTDRPDYDRSVFLLGAVCEVTTAHAEGKFALQNTTPLAVKYMYRVKVISWVSWHVCAWLLEIKIPSWIKEEFLVVISLQSEPPLAKLWWGNAKLSSIYLCKSMLTNLLLLKWELYPFVFRKVCKIKWYN